MSYEFPMAFAPQGWQCPICKRVYSPTTPMCWYCGNGVTNTTTSTHIKEQTLDLNLNGAYRCNPVEKGEKNELEK